MKICILGLGVIGTTYGYVFKKAGHQVEHLLREMNNPNVPSSLDVKILDGAILKKEKKNQINI